MRDRMVNYVKNLQVEIVSALEKFEPSTKFQKKSWLRPGGGGGDSCVLSNGKIFEKAGVNISVVDGDLPEFLVQKFKSTSSKFFATGISLVLHPHSPKVPTVHANFRYFEQPDRTWFGGGADLTPYAVSENDFKHFHSTLKKACDPFGADLYPKYKKECDEYFRIQHRDESRGIGGIFFDYLEKDLESKFDFVQSCGNSFLPAYIPIVERNQNLKFSEREKKFQLLRRGRYVEFNLVYDRGTLFGLQTKGNIESILMSLPPVVNFDYSADMETSEDEKKLSNWFKTPREWV
ncbi:MAG: oxygen-dependent coproporphyrinogen oxidase [Deltaproteobacteria bacterium]|nr:oxygen-dependent coproporphyrinogen oxidase [Deltaproteobacteria bacterium]